jgi:CheY-like chemotaxis protein
MTGTCLSCSQLFAGELASCPRCGRALTAPDGEPPLFEGRYLVQKEIGRGGGGRVLLARDVLLSRRVAIKVLAQAQPSQAVIDAFYREASALASVRSDHVAHVYAFGLSAEGPFFAMEFIEGVSLAHLIAEHARTGESVPRHRGLTVLKQVAQGLSVVHAAGVVHRDVKPANVVIEKHTGRAVLVDFGIAMHRGQAAEEGALWGTPAYMAPEQIHGGSPLTPSVDLYALACTAFELLVGRRPFEGESTPVLLAQHVMEPVPVPSSIRADLDVLDPIVSRGMAKAPEQRFESARAFAAAVDHALLQVHRRAPDPALASRAVEPASAAIRVLVIDDDPVFGVFATRALRAAYGARPEELAVTVLRNAAEALVGELGAHLILLDYEMPGMSGVELLSILRERPGGRELRVVVCSGSAGPDVIARFGLLGVTTFLQKPLEFPALVAQLKDIGRANGWLAPSPHDTPTVHDRRSLT